MKDGLNLNDYSEAVTDERNGRRRRSDSNSILAEAAKFLIPVLLAWGVSYLTAQGAVATEVAVVKATEQAHFDEIQRTLRRLDEWITRQELKPKGR